MNAILLIEDDPNARAGLSDLLHLEGYAVHCAGTGQEGIDLMRREEVDIVLCDFRLPDINGLNVCSEAKKIRPEARLFLLTAFMHSEMRDVAAEMHIQKIFPKPLQIDDLLKTLSTSAEKMASNHEDYKKVLDPGMENIC